MIKSRTSGYSVLESATGTKKWMVRHSPALTPLRLLASQNEIPYGFPEHLFYAVYEETLYAFTDPPLGPFTVEGGVKYVLADLDRAVLVFVRIPENDIDDEESA